MKLENFTIDIFADGANWDSIVRHNRNPLIKGFTTNPTLMRKSGIPNYEVFAKNVLEFVKEKPISFEVFSDDIEDMFQEAMKISTWGENVNVKIPVTNTKGQSTKELIGELVDLGVKVNVTAVFTFEQFEEVSNAIGNNESYISIFAGRIADTGVDPYPIIDAALKFMWFCYPKQKLIWASPREVYNVVQANEVGCHIITVTDDLLNKLSGLGKNLEEFSLDTVKMFYNDAKGARYSII